MRQIKHLIKTILQNRILQHILFWGLSFYVLLQLFSDSENLSSVDYIYTALFLFTLLVVVYLNLLVLVPQFLQQKKFALYTLASIAVLLLGAQFNLFFFNHLVDYILPGYFFISYYSFTDILKFFIVFLALTSLLKLSKEYFQLVEAKNKLHRAEKEKAQLELKALRAQVNPHFLFNSLNVIYSLVLKNSKEAPGVITRLSDILRYVIYDSNTDKVTIYNEIELINNFIELQKHRVESSSQIKFITDIEENVKIPPLLFLPLVENSFKHGLKGDVTDTFVHIHLKGNRQKIEFDIENNKGQYANVEKNKQGGIGIENIRHRLELLMPGQHRLEISENKRIFKVHLELRYEY